MTTSLWYGAIIAFALGIAVGTVWVVPLPTVCWLLLLALGLAVMRRWGSTADTPPPYLLFTSVLFCFLALGVLRMELAQVSEGASLLEPFVGTEVLLEGVVVREPDRREQTVHWYIKTSGGDTVLAYGNPFETVAYGDHVTITGTLARPESFTTDFDRTFNYPGYLLARDVEYVMYRPVVSVLASGQGNWLITNLLSAKQAFVSRLATQLHEPQQGLAIGLLLGVKQALGEELTTAFRQAGIIHIVVLSGYNVMLVVAFAMLVLSFFLPPRLRLWFGLVAIWCFALLVGLSATVVRATIMASIFLLATNLNRTYLVGRALFLAGVIMLLINPYLLMYDVGFQLSFMATLGLILVAPQFETILMKAPERLGAKSFFIATIATQLAVLPLLIYHIGEISLVSVLVNVLVLPVVPVAMLLTFIMGSVAFVSEAASTLLVYPTHAMLSYIILVAVWSVKIPYAAIPLPAVSVVVVPLLYSVGAGAWWWFAGRHTAPNRLTISSGTDSTIIKNTGAPAKDAPVFLSKKDEPPIFFR